MAIVDLLLLLLLLRMIDVLVCRSKQTQEEAVKLKRIQKELQALDDMVSSDISILRDRIEEASWDYSAARYTPTQRDETGSQTCLVKKGTSQTSAEGLAGISGGSVGNAAPCSTSSVPAPAQTGFQLTSDQFLHFLISRDGS